MGRSLRIVFLLMALVAIVLPMLLTGALSSQRSHLGDSVHGRPAEISAQDDEGLTVVADARGNPIPVREYQRIASCSTIADALLPDLVSPERVVSCTNWYAKNGRQGFQVAHLTHIHNIRDTERILSVDPDLVILSSFTGGELAPLERLREQGIPVFDLGDMLGMRTLLPNIRSLSAVLGAPERGETMATALERRMARVACGVPESERRSGMYLNVYDTQLSGGTIGASYYDVLSAAGLIDVAADFIAERTDFRRSWPRYRTEDILAIDPDVIVTATGKTAALRAVPGLENLRALTRPGACIELPSGLLNSCGPDMLLAAETLHALLYPESDTP
jgi:ABC-type Fe3+-hydroxamate transport system substrate-binding protein